MTICEFEAERLTLHASGDLSPADSREVETHLAGCPACSREHREVVATLAALEGHRAYPREDEVDWDAEPSPVVTLRVMDVEGAEVMRHDVALNTLSVGGSAR